MIRLVNAMVADGEERGNLSQRKALAGLPIGAKGPFRGGPSTGAPTQ